MVDGRRRQAAWRLRHGGAGLLAPEILFVKFPPRANRCGGNGCSSSPTDLSRHRRDVFGGPRIANQWHAAPVMWRGQFGGGGWRLDAVT